MSEILGYLKASDVSADELKALDALWQSLPHGSLRNFIAEMLDSLQAGRGVVLFTKGDS